MSSPPSQVAGGKDSYPKATDPPNPASSEVFLDSPPVARAGRAASGFLLPTQQQIEVFHNGEKHKNSNETQLSEELIQMIIRSVQKGQRQNSVRKKKRKRTTITSVQANGNGVDDERKAYSRCNISFFCEVLSKVRSCPQYVILVQRMGFGEVLHLDDCCVPRGFVRWIAKNVTTHPDEITIGSKSIKLSPQGITQTLGTPEGDLPVDSDETNGKAAFLAAFGLSEVPTIRYLGKKILGKEILPDDELCRSFMVVALATLFCPNSSTKISTKYMGALVVVEKIKDRNWSKFIHDWMMNYIQKYLREPVNPQQLTQTLGGCIYHLAVKDLDDTCYSSTTKLDSKNVTPLDVLKNDIDRAIGIQIGSKLKEEISTIYANLMKDEDTKMSLKAKDLVLQVIKAFVSSQDGSQDTIKLSCSNETSAKTAINSGSTEIIPDDENDEHDSIDALIRKKRRHTNSQHSDESITKKAFHRSANIKVDTQTDLPNCEVTNNHGPTSSQGMKSASLHHMVAEIDRTNFDTECADVSSKVVSTMQHKSTNGDLI